MLNAEQCWSAVLNRDNPHFERLVCFGDVEPDGIGWIAAEWVEFVEVSQRDHTGTLQLRLPTTFGEPVECRQFIVVWLRR